MELGWRKFTADIQPEESLSQLTYSIHQKWPRLSDSKLWNRAISANGSAVDGFYSLYVWNGMVFYFRLALAPFSFALSDPGSLFELEMWEVG